VIVGAQSRPLSGGDVFSEILVRGLRARGLDAGVLLPEDIERLALTDQPHAQPLVDQLERHAPALFLPGDDWRHWFAIPRLSGQIGAVVRVDDLDPPRLARAAQIGHYSNAMVAGSRLIAGRVIQMDPTLETRVVVIPPPIDVPDGLVHRPLEWGAPLKVAWVESAGTLRSPADRFHVIAALAEENVPVEVTTVPEDADAAVFERADVLVSMSEPEGVTTRLLESMGRGCVPVVARGDAVDLVKDGVNGYVLPGGDIAVFLARLRALQANAALRRSLSVRAFETADRGAYRTADMVASYMTLFDRVWRDIDRGAYRRPAGAFPAH
jgi:hypothetical protein